MGRTHAWILPTLITIALARADSALAATVDFEDVGQNLPIGEHLYYDGADGAGGYTSGAAHFTNNYSGGFWDGWSYSQTTDTTTPDFTNQFSAISGGGAGGSATYGVGFEGFGPDGIPTIAFDAERIVQGAWLTNTTYAALSMRDGDAFAKKFGGASGSDPDWFQVSVLGYDAADVFTDRVDVYLADFRFADDSQDYILDEWTFFDLTGLGSVKRIEFTFSGSDVGDFGLNTPKYVALDDLVAVPEPGSAALLAGGLVWLARRPARGRALRSPRVG
jgi:hypothetical protein